MRRGKPLYMPLEKLPMRPPPPLTEHDRMLETKAKEKFGIATDAQIKHWEHWRAGQPEHVQALAIEFGDDLVNNATAHVGSINDKDGLRAACERLKLKGLQGRK